VSGSRTLRIDYGYDVYGNRISRSEYDGSLTLVKAERFAYDGWKTGAYGVTGQANWDVWADLNGSNALVARRIFGNSIDSPEATISASGAESWYITDRQGSVVRRLNGTGSVLNSITYDGFGHATQTNASNGDRYLYTGREYDAAVDLLHLRDRVMAMDINVFLTKDRMGFAAGDLQLYRYAGNGFTNGSDPSGNYLFFQNEQESNVRGRLDRKFEGRYDIVNFGGHSAVVMRPGAMTAVEEEYKLQKPGFDQSFWHGLAYPDDGSFMIERNWSISRINASSHDASRLKALRTKNEGGVYSLVGGPTVSHAMFDDPFVGLHGIPSTTKALLPSVEFPPIDEIKSSELRFAIGFYKAGANTVLAPLEVMMHPDDAVKGVHALITDEKVRAAVVAGIKEKLTSGKAQDIGALVVEIPQAAVGVAGLTKFTIQVSVKVTKGTVQLLRAEAKVVSQATKLLDDAGFSAPNGGSVVSDEEVLRAVRSIPEHYAPKTGPKEAFKSPAAAIGDLQETAKHVGSGKTNNPQWIEWGYTETHYFRDSNGVKWTVFRNPKTGEYSGAHMSSGQ